MCCIIGSPLSPGCAGASLSIAGNTRVSKTNPCGNVSPPNKTGTARPFSAGLTNTQS